MPTHDNSGKDDLSLGLLPQARFILTYVNLLASSSVKNPASVSQLINSGCLALCQTILRLAGPDESKSVTYVQTDTDKHRWHDRQKQRKPQKLRRMTSKTKDLVYIMPSWNENKKSSAVILSQAKTLAKKRAKQKTKQKFVVWAQQKSLKLHSEIVDTWILYKSKYVDNLG